MQTRVGRIVLTVHRFLKREPGTTGHRTYRVHSTGDELYVNMRCVAMWQGNRILGDEGAKSRTALQCRDILYWMAPGYGISVIYI